MKDEYVLLLNDETCLKYLRSLKEILETAVFAKFEGESECKVSIVGRDDHHGNSDDLPKNLSAIQVDGQ